ncbi:hypothetical protein BJV77DRAFT_942948 [Russula vinacea]|nr:hypothetical protein BJV77DRAFT_942948 [Russula vinacea]
MSTATPSELDGLFHQLQRRMVESGEWDRILLQLRYQLRDSGWMDSTQARTRTYSKSVLWPQNLPTLLIDNVQDVPEAVKQQILSSIRSFLDKQIE